ncbi:MAG: intradiol ring-cleavage dioxygenase [Nitrospirota bacterium]|nr:MAG: intradiol ring-cleavage dioxygenase [Nitrospirota bacterium]
MRYSIPLVLLIILLAPVIVASEQCVPTRPDMLGPFYKSGAPERTEVGKGYVMVGVVRSAEDCSAVEGAVIELWLTGPNGKYGDDYRAKMYSGKDGRYRFESNPPLPYFGRPPHIHIKVTANGYKELITQHYPSPNTDMATFDLVLIPE